MSFFSVVNSLWDLAHAATNNSLPARLQAMLIKLCGSEDRNQMRARVNKGDLVRKKRVRIQG